MALYNFSGNTFRERGERYVGPCQIESPRDDLDKLFPDVFEKVGDKSKSVKVSESADTAETAEAEQKQDETSEEEESTDKTFSRGKKSNEEQSKLTPVHRGGGKYNVEKPDGEPINSQLLTKQEAYEMCGIEEE